MASLSASAKTGCSRSKSSCSDQSAHVAGTQNPTQRPPKTRCPPVEWSSHPRRRFRCQTQRCRLLAGPRSAHSRLPLSRRVGNRLKCLWRCGNHSPPRWLAAGFTSAEQVQLSGFVHSSRGRCSGSRRSCSGRGIAQNAPSEGAEFEVFQGAAKRFSLWRIQGHQGPIVFHRNVEADGGQFFGEQCELGVFFDALLEFSFQLPGVLYDPSKLPY